MARNRPSLASDGPHDDRSIARPQRKRRASSTRPSPSTAPDPDAPNPTPDPHTPHKPKKRVRFSDPNPDPDPDISATPATRTAMSTGLTPFVQRTSLAPPLSPTPRLLAQAPRRRRSMPALSRPRSSSAAETMPTAVEVQIVPLRQVLDERVKRRLRRNHFSEEINAIEGDRKLDARRRQEVRQLREELALAWQLGSEVVGGCPGGRLEAVGNGQTIQELQDEIMRLKAEGCSRSETTDLASSWSTDDTVLLATGTEGIGEKVEDAAGPLDDDIVLVDLPSSSNASCTIPTTTAAAQTALVASDIDALHAYIRTQTAHLTHARLQLEHICPGETPLGLAVPDGDAAPLLSTLLARLRAIKTELTTTSAALAVSQTQECNLRTQFNTTLHQLSALRTQASALTARTQHLTTTRAAARAAVDEGDLDREKLRRALDLYRAEVKNLEGLVTQLEQDHKANLTALSTEHDGVVADLEAQVAAETRGRRDAEAEAEDRMLRIRALEGLLVEVRGALGEKQALIRVLECDMESAATEKEKELGVLNVRVAALAAETEGLKDEIQELEGVVQRLETERGRLVEDVKAEKENGMRALDAVAKELKGGFDRAENVAGEYAVGIGEREKQRDERAGVWKGLLTPTVEGGRFRDACRTSCDGAVEVRRGKWGRRGRKVDSGIGLLEEDAEEDDGESQIEVAA